MTKQLIKHVNLILSGDVAIRELLGHQSFRGRYWRSQQLLNLIPLKDHESCNDAERYEGEIVRRGDGFSIRLPQHESPVSLYLVTEADRNARLPFPADQRVVLRTARVAMVGCGSLGSAIAPMLVRAGIRSIHLCDPGLLGPSNLSRHLGTAFDMGRLKSEVVADRLSQLDPGVEPEVITEDLLDWDWPRRRDFWSGFDAVIATTDKRSVQLCVNEDLVRCANEPNQAEQPSPDARKLPGAGVFAGCFDEARGGEVFVVNPSEDAPCLACLRGGLDGPERVGTMDYSTATSAEDFRGEPGLDAAVHQVAAIAAQVVLAVLLRGCPESELGKLVRPEQNYLLIGTAMAAGFYRFGHAFQAGFQALSGRRKGCSACDGHANRSVQPPMNYVDLDRQVSGAATASIERD